MFGVLGAETKFQCLNDISSEMRSTISCQQNEMIHINSVILGVTLHNKNMMK